MWLISLSVLQHWYHKCPLTLSSYNDLCLCVTRNHIYIQNENGLLEKWLTLKNRTVSRIHLTTVDTNLICKNIYIGLIFEVNNMSWFCGNDELEVVTDYKACYG